MRTATVKLFNIHELRDEAQQTAVDYLREHDFYGADEDMITERFNETLKEYGLPTETVEWRLSNCQGDGVAFYGDIDIERLMIKTGKWDQWRMIVRRYDLGATSQPNSFASHYSHYNTMDVYMQRGSEYIDRDSILLGRDIWEHIKETVVSVSRQLEKEGYEMIEANQDKQYIIDTAYENDMEFREDGRLWGG